MKNSEIGLPHVLSWPKLGLEPEYRDPGTFGGFGKLAEIDRQTRFMLYKYRYSKITWFVLYIGWQNILMTA